MHERENLIFTDQQGLHETPGIRQRAAKQYLQSALGGDVQVEDVSLNDSGVYQNSMKKITGLPPYVCVSITHTANGIREAITVWSPLRWNGRFYGTGGGGTATGGVQYIEAPKNTTRGMTLPKAILNGFTAATTDAGNGKKLWAVENGVLLQERIENWRSRSTHLMTVLGKRVAEILHDRPVEYAYFHGSSGGGRQAMVEAQDWPEDYNGIWASCPAIHWTKVLLESYWPIALMNDAKHTVNAEAMKAVTEAVRDSVGGEAAFYQRRDKVDFDPYSLVGTHGITREDAAIVQALWDGPRRTDGGFLWYGYRPGVQFWNVGIPVGGYYYQFLTRRVRPFFLCRHYLCWITEDEKTKKYDMTRREFELFLDRGIEKFASSAADNADLTAFRACGGKLIMDHGTADPLIPVDGSIDYWRRVDAREAFLRLYITPGDGHGTCDYFGPGLTEAAGSRALMDWVERGIAPGELPTVRVGKKGEVLMRSTVQLIPRIIVLPKIEDFV